MARWRNKPAWSLLALVLLLLSASIAPAVVIATARFTIVFSSKDSTDARLVAGYAEESVDRISRDLGAETAIEGLRVPIHVYSTRRDFLSETGTNKQTLVVGKAWSSGPAQRIEIDASGTYSRIETIVAHEVTHVVIARMLSGRVNALPLWANEGIARIESREYGTVDGDIVGDALSGGRFIPLREIERRFPDDNERVSLAYAEGTSFMNYIREKGGPGSLKRILRTTAASGDFEKAVRDVTGLPLNSLEKGWRRSVSKSYLSGWLPRNLPFSLGVLMAILCVAAYLAIKRRQRWNAARWMIEESFEDTELDYGEPPE